MSLGTYEPWVHSILDRELNPDSRLWDIGAHIGYYLLWAAKVSSHTHLAVEPDPKTLLRLRLHLASNDVDVEVAAVATGSHVGIARFSSANHSLVSQISSSGELEVPIVTLDSLLHGRVPPTIVMMDIEGAEGATLRGGQRLLKDLRPVWLVELHGEGGFDAYEQFIEAGYEIETQVGPPIPEQLETHRVHILARPL